MGRHQAPVQFGGQLGQLHAVVDAGDQRGVVDVVGAHHMAVGAHDRDDVGQVQLVLGVVGAQPAQRRAQRGDVEGVHPGVDLGDRLLRRGGVGLFDDADDVAVLGAQHPAVAGRVGQGGGQHRDQRRFGAVGGHQFGQGRGVEQRYVPRGHDDDPGEVLGQRAEPADHGVTCAQLLFLHGNLHVAVQVPADVEGGGRHAFPVAAHDDHEMPWRHLRHRVQRMGQHAAPGQGVQHLGSVGLHPGARSCSENQDGGLTHHSPSRGPHPASVRVCPSTRRSAPAFRARSPRSLLRRQDSNLNYLNQNQRCCRLHHDGPITQRL